MRCPGTVEGRIAEWRKFAQLCRDTAVALRPETYAQHAWLRDYVDTDAVMPSAELPVHEQISACGSAACLAGTMTFIHPAAREALAQAVATTRCGFYGQFVERGLDLFTPADSQPGRLWLYSGDPAGSWPAPFCRDWEELGEVTCDDPTCDCSYPTSAKLAEDLVRVAREMLIALADTIDAECAVAGHAVTCDWDASDDSTLDLEHDPWGELYDLIESRYN